MTPRTLLQILAAAGVIAASSAAGAQSNAAKPANAGSGATSTRAAPEPAPQEGSDADDGMSTGNAYQRTGGSLLRASRGVEAPGEPNGSQIDGRVADMSLFAVPPPERRVIRPHDLITVIIKEQSEFKSEGTTSLDKKASLEAEISQFIRLNLNQKKLENIVGSAAPKIDVSGQMNFDGQGSAERKDSLSVRMQAEVVDVKPNGNLVLQSRRRIKTDDEERVFLVSGVVRVQDVTTDNTVLSTQMYDFDLRQDTKGTVRAATRRGWLPRLLDALNPF